jgi:hypothetical protein
MAYITIWQKKKHDEARRVEIAIFAALVVAYLVEPTTRSRGGHTSHDLTTSRPS